MNLSHQMLFSAATPKKWKGDPSFMEKEVTVVNTLGLHARPASMIAKCASNFSSEIMIDKSGEIANGKSILGIMTLAAGKGTKLFESGFGEG